MCGMKLFDLDKWEREGHEELARSREEAQRSATEGAGEPHTWILVVTAVALVLAGIAAAANGIMQANGIGDFGGDIFFYGMAALFVLVGIAYGVGVLAGRTAASSRSISLAENVITMVCAVVIAIAVIFAAIYRVIG